MGRPVTRRFSSTTTRFPARSFPKCISTDLEADLTIGLLSHGDRFGIADELEMTNLVGIAYRRRERASVNLIRSAESASGRLRKDDCD